MRRPYIVGNWKMNTNRAEALDLAQCVIATGAFVSGCAIAICVPFPHLAPVQAELVMANSPVMLGAQDVYWEPSGAFTGEVSVRMLQDYCRVVIIGHSERRQFFGETNESVRRKTKAVLASSTLDPIVCVGETLVDRHAGRTEIVLTGQLFGGLHELPLSSRLTIAYEPVWAIGTGETATPEVAQETCKFIRKVLRTLGGDVADEICIQYGGSVNTQNARSLLSQPDIDGALVGGAALKPDEFTHICTAASGH